MLRLFVGLGLPDAERDTLSMLERGIPGARWVDADNYHITLRFIGEVPESDADDIHAALSAIRFARFRISLAGVGHFGKLRKARSLWAGIEPDAPVRHLHAKVESAIVRAGFPPEERRFRPHVTLARMKGETGHHLANFLSEHGDFRRPAFEVACFHLFRSQLTRSGPVYETLWTYDADAAIRPKAQIGAENG